MLIGQLGLVGIYQLVPGFGYTVPKASDQLHEEHLRPLPKGVESVEISTDWLKSMGAPVGNQNAAKAKVWSSAINRALEKRGVSRAEALEALAEKLLELADDGDLGALKELGDRLEGKAAQTIQGPEGESLFGPVVQAAEELRKSLK